MHPARKNMRATNTTAGPYWGMVQLLDGSQLSGCITEEEHRGVRLYRVERRGTDGDRIVEYYGFISISRATPMDPPRIAGR